MAARSAGVLTPIVSSTSRQGKRVDPADALDPRQEGQEVAFAGRRAGGVGRGRVAGQFVEIGRRAQREQAGVGLAFVGHRLAFAPVTDVGDTPGRIAIEMDVRFGFAAGRQRQRDGGAAGCASQAGDGLRPDADLIAPGDPDAATACRARTAARGRSTASSMPVGRRLVVDGRLEAEARGLRRHRLAIDRPDHDVPAIDPGAVERGQVREHRTGRRPGGAPSAATIRGASPCRRPAARGRAAGIAVMPAAAPGRRRRRGRRGRRQAAARPQHPAREVADDAQGDEEDRQRERRRLGYAGRLEEQHERHLAGAEAVDGDRQQHHQQDDRDEGEVDRRAGRRCRGRARGTTPAARAGPGRRSRPASPRRAGRGARRSVAPRRRPPIRRRGRAPTADAGPARSGRPRPAC